MREEKMVVGVEDKLTLEKVHLSLGWPQVLTDPRYVFE